MSTAPKLVFAGTPEFAVPSLEAAIASGCELQAVYTQPDRPAGRGRQLTASPVKLRALEAGIEVRQPQSLRDPDAQAALQVLQPDLLVVIAYGLILPQRVLDIPRHGGWNLHASLLPRWRGAAPIQRAIEAGDQDTGVCLMQMAAGLDTGPVLLHQQLTIAANETAGSLHDRLAKLSAEVLSDGLKLLRAGLKPQAVEQPEAGVLYAHKLNKAEARLDWSQPAELLERRIRAFNPWPIAEASLAGERLRIHSAVLVDPSTADGLSTGAPGEVIAANRAGIDVACGGGALRLLRVQRDGGKAISAADYLNARPDLPRG